MHIYSENPHCTYPAVLCFCSQLGISFTITIQKTAGCILGRLPARLRASINYSSISMQPQAFLESLCFLVFSSESSSLVRNFFPLQSVQGRVYVYVCVCIKRATWLKLAVRSEQEQPPLKPEEILILSFTYCSWTTADQCFTVERKTEKATTTHMLPLY